METGKRAGMSLLVSCLAGGNIAAAQGPVRPQAVAYSFVLDLAGTPLGEIPTAIKQTKGMLEVVMNAGQPMLKASASSEFTITLPQPLPQVFTLEFDLVPKACCNPQDLSFEGTATINQGAGSAHVLWDSDGYLAIIGGGPNNYEAPMPEDLRTSLPGVLTSVVAIVEGPTIKLYTNGRRMYTLDRTFARGRVLRVFLGGQDDNQQAVYLAGLRISAGAMAPTTIATNPTPPPGQPTAAPPPPAPPPGTQQTLTKPTQTLPVVPPPPPALPPGSPTGPTATMTSALNTSPVGPTAFSAFSLTGATGYGIGLQWIEAPNATSYRVYRGTTPSSTVSPGSGISGQVISVLDLTRLVTVPGARLALDALTYPATTYAYWVEAVFADGSVSLPSTTQTVTEGSPHQYTLLWPHNLRATVSPTMSTLVTSLQAGTPLSLRGGSVTMPGSNVTWTWDPAGSVFGYEIEWSVVDNGVTLVFGRERVAADWSGMPGGPITVTPVAKGIPAGKTVRFCVAFYSDPDPTKPLDPNSGPCVTSQTPAAVPTNNIVQGGPISPRGTVTVMSTGAPPWFVDVQGSGTVANVAWASPSVPQPANYTYSVSRALAGTTAWTLLTPAPVTSFRLQDILPDPTRTYTYQVRATAPDGTFGTASADYTPVPPADPAGFTAKQIGDGEVELRWIAVANVTQYRISGPGAGNGVTVAGTIDLSGRYHKVTGVPVGQQTWTIASVYTPGGVLTTAAGWPKATATVAALSGRYRVTLLGFEVNRATLMDWGTDGRGDEVFLSAFVTSVHRVTLAQGAQGIIQSVVYGDVLGQPQREMAGTISPQGGLKTGDSYPLSGGGSWPVVVPQKDRLPMLLWEGPLVAGADVLLIHPAIWESDVAAAGGSSGSFPTWVTGVTAAFPKTWAGAAVAAEMNSPGLRWIRGPDLSFSLQAPIDHPIGMERINSLGVALGYTQPVLVMTREKIESVLSAPQTVGGLAPGIVTVPVRDAFADDYNGHYTMYLRVERVP